MRVYINAGKVERSDSYLRTTRFQYEKNKAETLAISFIKWKLIHTTLKYTNIYEYAYSIRLDPVPA